MIQLPCPWCGPRNVSEFRYVGEAHRRPDVATTTPAEWRAYLYEHDNPAGWVRENWYHRAGCRRYLSVERHTVTNEARPATLPQHTAFLGTDARSEQPSTTSEPGAGGGPV